ncbi:hypothetical protein HCU74_19270 [Spongiibacter sp. KMU-166]|uniref:Polysaccharide biosynthesis protein n=1 Tax=Spongiibacter thalassae TaxID=2721624 RepID=A0ABX1GM65_9GAMM|nr:hypothetical protein [Spongiibacter thalassae]NKI19553.1 hypothetical protein [Spongiibacter thalassae]
MLKVLLASKASVVAQVLAFACLLLLEGSVNEDIIKNLFILLGLQRFSNLFCGLRLELVSKVSAPILLTITLLMAVIFVECLYLVDKYTTFNLLHGSASSQFELIFFFFASTLWNFVNFRAACLDHKEALLIRVARPLALLIFIVLVLYVGLPENGLVWWVAISFLAPSVFSFSKVLKSPAIGNLPWTKSYFFSNFVFSFLYLMLDLYLISTIVESENFVEVFVFYRILTVLTTALASNHRAIHLFTEGEQLQKGRVLISSAMILTICSVLILLIDEAAMGVIWFLFLIAFICFGRLYFSIVSSGIMKKQNMHYILVSAGIACIFNVSLFLGYLSWKVVAIVPVLFSLVAILVDRD